MERHIRRVGIEYTVNRGTMRLWCCCCCCRFFYWYCSFTAKTKIQCDRTATTTTTSTPIRFVFAPILLQKKRVIYFRFAIFSNYLSKNETSACLLLTAATPATPAMASSTLEHCVCVSITLFTVCTLDITSRRSIAACSCSIRFFLRFTHIRFIRKHHQYYVLSSTNLFYMILMLVSFVLYFHCECLFFSCCSHLCVNISISKCEP